MTYLRGFIGPKNVKPEHQPWLLEGRTKGPQFPANFLDGTSNTFLVAEAATAVPWSKPDDLVYDGVMPVPKLGGPNGRFVVGFADGSVATFRRGQLDETILRAAITVQGGEVVNIPGR
jgi:prepilin-type processing-associated H-X9-DG protein